MNTVFEQFIRVALREALRLDVHAFPAAARGRSIHLDAEHGVPLEPDLSWWDGGRCVFVGDCKHKKAEGTIPNADVYQMLAYLTALQLADGLLIYAVGEDAPHTTTVPFADKRVLVRTIDVTQAPHDVFTQIAKLAGRIRCIASASAVTS